MGYSTLGRGLFIAVAGSLALSGCGAGGPSSAEQQRLTNQFYEYLKGRTFAAEVRTNHLCTEVFDLSAPRLLDSSSEGSNGKLRIAIDATFKGPYRYFQLVPTVVYPADCYGAPPQGLVAGQTMTSTYEVNIERWNSGWRISDGQDFRPM